MNHTDQIKMLLSMFAVQLPTLIVCLAAGVVVLTKWRQAPRSSLWAILGFGLVLALCVVMPVVQTAIFQSHDNANRGLALSILGIVGSVLHAIAYVLLLVAVFAGRPALHNTNPRL